VCVTAAPLPFVKVGYNIEYFVFACLPVVLRRRDCFIVLVDDISDPHPPGGDHDSKTIPPVQEFIDIGLAVKTPVQNKMQLCFPKIIQLKQILNPHLRWGE